MQARQKARKKRNRTGLIGLALVTGVVCGATIGAFLALTHDLPQIQALESFKPSAVTRIFSADQHLLDELYVQRREPVPLSDIPKPLITALLTTEDRRFYSHSGIDIRGITRAALRNIMRRRFSEGASTLTQQLAKTLFLTHRKTLIRKIREALLALQLERRYTKNEILNLYLNQVYFGSGAYGVAMASRTYFNKPVQSLTLAECALIAGLPQLPSRYSPLVNPELAKKRRDIVLAQMRTTGAIDEQAYQHAVQSPILTAAVKRQRRAPHFIAYIKQRLGDIIGENLLYKGGLTVYTTLSADLQVHAEAAVATHLKRLASRMQKNGTPTPEPQAALVALDLKRGGILSMVGGKNTSADGFNRAVTAARQPGSAFKPIVFAKAIERGFNQNDTLLDAPVVFQSGALNDDWQPENFSKNYSGQVSLRFALAHSKNIPAVRLIEILGPSAVIDFAHRLGIDADLSPNLSLALGTSEVSLIDLTAAYAVFGNQGNYIEPYGITEVRSDEGRIIWRTKPEQRIVMSRSSAAIMTDVLEAAIQE
ncbi:MAG: PBP1A family penicillin-binding protein, partial [Desulfatitalea sp.]|nr:PBP1A family penicillin-binding protein [Desulfatitalea sp.]NNK02544.1 PBP1A family penicillin-binding protein [Desulfatitalea sp.]